MNKNKSNIIFIILLFILAFSQSTFSQSGIKNITISGHITDYLSGEKLTGVNVYLKGTTTGTATDNNGYYSLKFPEGKHTVVFSFVGYEPQERTLARNNDQEINVKLKLIEEILGEVKITSQRKFFGNMDYGRDIPSIDAKVIGKLNSNNASDILHASVAGVWATKTSGAPGDQQKIRVRGQASFFSSAEPLYVIDGVPVPIVNLASLGIADLNIHDIDNVTVLKDASSTALYGYQGGNGVILIDTKKTSESSINFSVKTGMQWFNNFYDLMNTHDFLESLKYANKTIESKLWEIHPQYSDSLCDHDRQKEIFQNGFIQEYQLSGGGNKNSIKYYLSGSYTRQKGILPGSLYERGTFTARVSRNLGKKLVLDFSYRGSFQNNKNNQNVYNGNRVIFEGIGKSPCLECTPDSFLNTDRDRRILNNYSALNSAELLQSIIDNSQLKFSVYNHATSIMGRYQLNNFWSINVIESFLLRKINYDNEKEDVRLFNHQINLAFNKNVGLSNINMVLAQRIYTDNLSWNVDTAASLPAHFYLRNSMARYGMKGSVIRKLDSYIANFSYSYNKAFFLSAIANVSRLKEGLYIDYYTLFPSLSLSCDISKLPFIPATNWLDELSIYSNIGSSGNYPLNGLANDIFGEVTYSNGEIIDTNTVIYQLSNHNLRHESTAEFDLGLKSSFLNKRLNINASFFSKSIGNQIIQREIPMYYGGGIFYVNMGNIKVSGYEISIEAMPVKRKFFNWYLNGNFSTSEQRVTKLADGQDMVFYSGDILFPEFIIKENEPLGNIYGYKCLGKWSDEYKNKRSYINVGNLVYLNNDSTDKRINENDKVIIGNSVPDFNWSLSNTFQYKNFSIDFTIYSVWGVNKFNATRAGTIMTGVNQDVLKYYADTVKAVYYDEFYESSLFVDDASFIRLKTLTLNYEPQKRYMGVAFRFSLSFENLITITNYRGYDPEATIFTDNNFSDNAIDRGAYPNPKGVYATVNLKF